MKGLALPLLVAILLAACQPVAAPEPTAVPPTASPTPTAASLETLATSVNDLLGVWWFSSPGVELEFRADGKSRVFFGDTTIDQGDFAFDNGKIVWGASSSCGDKPATYEAYVTKQDGQPAWLRLQVVGSDPCPDRAGVTGHKAKFQHP